VTRDRQAAVAHAGNGVNTRLPGVAELEADDAGLGQEGQVVFQVPVFGDAVVSDALDVLTTGMGEYTRSGVIGRPSLASAEKGKALLASLVDSFASVLEILQRG
jgi:creatinine amidohydrolase/Fe(II)-dependent formamide hydrolase-like protein